MIKKVWNILRIVLILAIFPYIGRDNRVLLIQDGMVSESTLQKLEKRSKVIIISDHQKAGYETIVIDDPIAFDINNIKNIVMDNPDSEFVFINSVSENKSSLRRSVVSEMHKLFRGITRGVDHLLTRLRLKHISNKDIIEARIYGTKVIEDRGSLISSYSMDIANALRSGSAVQKMVLLIFLLDIMFVFLMLLKDLYSTFTRLLFEYLFFTAVLGLKYSLILVLAWPFVAFLTYILGIIGFFLGY